MKAMSIGEIGKMTGLAPSAIRYYEKAGLMPKPGRLSGQRRYGSESVGRLRIVQLARDAGFTIAETRLFLSGFTASERPAARWRALAEKKLAQIEATIQRFAQMKDLLESSFRCECPRIEDCDRAAAAGCGQPKETRPNGRSAAGSVRAAAPRSARAAGAGR